MVANRNALKSYAPQARKDFIQAMMNRAALFGITRAGAASGEERGELLLLKGKAFPKSVAEQRKRLIDRIAATSFDQTLEAVAYTWFNRFLAIRYMELHGYLDHGYRVLSHPAGEAEPEILQQAQHLTLPGLDPDVVVDLKLRGDQDEALYRQILIAQCNDLHRSMPFLFERIEDETELLLPENLLQSDSIIRKLVNQIVESEWDEIEIIGWLYQFYISEKKDQVMGKVVKSEDIPAATQLFTPNWIVKYMVQNSLGAQWLATYPDSPLKAAMAYYIEPAKQSLEAQAQLDAITPKTLDPETLTLIDPAVGSGHILVEAYDLFRAIYIERGYTPRAAARLILTKNLYGLDIDDRAAQMAGFALMMKARADDRALLSDPPALNVMSLTDSGGWGVAAMVEALTPAGRVELLPATDLLPETLAQPTLSVSAEERGARAAIADIVALFDGAKTFGSLITVPEAVMASLPGLEALLERPVSSDLLRRDTQIEAKERLAVLVAQAKLLGRRYDCAAANPPYMGSKGMEPRLKEFIQKLYQSGRSDLFAAFIDRNLQFCSPTGVISMITMQSWMFLSSYEALREKIISDATILSVAHLGTRAFDSIGGEVVSTTAFSIARNYNRDYLAKYFKLTEEGSEDRKRSRFINLITTPTAEAVFTASAAQLSGIPGSPAAYWVSNKVRSIFQKSATLGSLGSPTHGVVTGDNDTFLRLWAEVDISNVKFGANDRAEAQASGARWFPVSKGGPFRRWYGNNEHLINWEADGRALRTTLHHTGRIRATNFNLDRIFQPGITWSTIASNLSMRYFEAGMIFESKGSVCFSDDEGTRLYLLSLCNSKVVNSILSIISPTLDYHEGPMSRVPVVDMQKNDAIDIAKRCMEIAKFDWDQFEDSWSFQQSPLIAAGQVNSLSKAYAAARAQWTTLANEMEHLEVANNRLFIDAYGLADELTPNVPLAEITLTCNPHYRYGGDLTEAEREARLLSDTMRELVSYGVGLMMGRYSLAEPGLIYALASNEGFNSSRYGAFPADDDGIVPITEEPWFADDAAARLEQFLAIAWPKAPIGETLATLTDGLIQGKGGEPRAALRAYLAKTFYRDHLQTYRNRPIYWLFSSGKQKAFECLVYLHRYNESTLARMRTTYVTPLMGKMQQRISDLEAEIAGSASSAEKARKGRDRDKTVKQLAELRAFDEELRHLADQRIALDLDDGVKVNYGRFGNLLAAKDKVCGKDNDKDD